MGRHRDQLCETSQVQDHNDKLVTALSENSETLDRLQDSFAMISSTFRIYTFIEDAAKNALVPGSSVGKVSSKFRIVIHG